MGIREIPLPYGAGRVATGAVRFNQDWPGLFIRGDDCMRLKLAIEGLSKSGSTIDVLGELKEIIDKNVIQDLPKIEEDSIVCQVCGCNSTHPVKATVDNQVLWTMCFYCYNGGLFWAAQQALRNQEHIDSQKGD